MENETRKNVWTEPQVSELDLDMTEGGINAGNDGGGTFTAS